MRKTVRRLGDVEPRTEILPGSPEPLLRLAARERACDADRAEALRLQAALPEGLGRLRQGARRIQQGMERDARAVGRASRRWLLCLCGGAATRAVGSLPP